MSLDKFIPEVWSQQLLVAHRKNLVYGQEPVVNTDYQGEISAFGDTVHVHSHGAVTVGTYSRHQLDASGNPTGTDLNANRQNLDSSRVSLTIDQAKYFNFEIDDLDAAQTKPKVMQNAMNDAAYRLADQVDQHIAGKYTDATTSVGGTASADQKGVTGSTTAAYDYLFDLGVALTEQNVPQGGRWVVVPAWYHGLLQKDDRFVATGDSASEEVRLNGQVGKAAGFRILVSNNSPSVNDASDNYDYDAIISGYVGAASHAEQVNTVEAYRPENAFADAVKGLLLYGSKLVRTESWAILYVDKNKAA